MTSSCPSARRQCSPYVCPLPLPVCDFIPVCSLLPSVSAPHNTCVRHFSPADVQSGEAPPWISRNSSGDPDIGCLILVLIPVELPCEFSYRGVESLGALALLGRVNGRNGGLSTPTGNPGHGDRSVKWLESRQAPPCLPSNMCFSFFVLHFKMICYVHSRVFCLHV